ncbi:family 16 glycoside hydrolase [Streptomyces sp. CBMA152]|uniref:family 16 glycoside hydrolase n=1 Tax=Streptomyces sp. CBMA152 TaxID=1896312 RepID=UPI001CB7291A|nr:family 16 glycoside hydrolase [Streptomyces sp. CBMA152]
MTTAPRLRRPVMPGEPGSRRRRALALALAAALLAAGAFGLSQCAGGNGSGQQEPWADGTAHGHWQSVFNGHGVNSGDDKGLQLAPEQATDPGTTHAGLVVSLASYGDVRYEARMRTVKQLRTPAPNSWEVAWLVWGYTDPEHFYYITLKPNGWELGKRDPAYPGGQRFLATGQQPFPVGKWYSVEVAQHGARLQVAVNTAGLADFTDIERPYLRGAVGAYTEDARVEFRDLKVR